MGSEMCIRDSFQLRALFTELLTRVPHVTAGEPELMPGNFFHVVKRMPATV